MFRRHLIPKGRRANEPANEAQIHDAAQGRTERASSTASESTFLDTTKTIWRSTKSSIRTRTPSPHPLVSADATPPPNTTQPTGSALPLRSSGVRASRDGDPLGLTVLYKPEAPPTADIIFVHGLGGSSRLSWCKDRDLDLFWPQNWLPSDRDMSRARILTFGYSARFSEIAQSTMVGITDFAKNLLYDLIYARDKDGDLLELGKVPIFVVAHSMGGLVFKKAFLDGQLDVQYQRVVDAIRAVIFLSTPHRGANLAEFLNRVLSLVPTTSSKQYVAELGRDGPFLKTVNEQFRHAAGRLEIFSFYETLQTQIGVISTMILDGDDAKLGYPREVSRSLHADHHDVCKFSSKQDSNYQVVLGALKSLVTSSIILDSESSANDMAKLEGLLSVSSPPERDLSLFWSRRAESTCSWILEQPQVLSWASTPTTSGVLWLHGRPARGKSVLSSFLVHHLQDQGAAVQYFFFRSGDETKRSISSLLRSLAFQIAEEVPIFRKSLLTLINTGWKPKEVDWRATWKKLFVNSLFQLNFHPPLFWVIDGVDECGSVQHFFELLSDLHLPNTPIRLLFTSRWSPSLSTNFGRIASRTQSTTVSIDHDITDIEIYAECELDYLGWDKDIKREVLSRILQQANDNFLWVSLILNEIKDCNTEEDVILQLDQLPTGMDSLYQRIEASISNSRRPSDKALAQQLLMWAVHARRSISLEELMNILEPQFGRLLDISNTINRLCGHFVVIEGGSQVALLHQTVREYLITSSSLPFTVEADEAHKLILETCASAFQDKFDQNKLTASSRIKTQLEYRATSWPHHLGLIKNGSELDATVDILVRFFTQPSVLKWIHILAEMSQLKILIEASQCIRSFVERKRKRDAGTEPALRRFEDLELLERWSRDLLKLPGKFGSSLARDPSSIYKSVPAFCPTGSAIYKTFATFSSASPTVTGLAEDWDDCLARVLVGGHYPASSLCCSGRHLAVVNTVGSISIWDSVTFHRIQLLEHGEPVSSMCFSPQGDRLATYGSSSTKLWDPRSGLVWQTITNLPSTPALSMCISQDGSELLMGSERRCVLRAQLDNDEKTSWTIVDPLLLNDNEFLEGTYLNAPNSLSFSPDGRHVAVTYRRFPLTIWSINPAKILKRVNRHNIARGRATNSLPFAIKVSWHPTSDELMGIYVDGHVFRVSIVDETYSEQLPELGQMPADIQCSPDGQTYAICSYHGAIKLYDYQTSTLIYQLTAENMISAFSFSLDGRRLYDIRGSYCNIWEPNVLIRLSAEDEHPTYSSLPDESVERSILASECVADSFLPLTLISPIPSGSIVCLGDEDGSVELYDYSTNQRYHIDKTATSISIERLVWSADSRHFCYTEVNSRVTLVEVESLSPGWKHKRLARFKPDLEGSGVQQLLMHPNGDSLIIIYKSSIRLWSLQPPELQCKQDITLSIADGMSWIQHPTSTKHIICVTPYTANLYTWDSLEEIISWSIADDVGIGHGFDTATLRSLPSHHTDDTEVEESVEQLVATHLDGFILATITRRNSARMLASRFLILDVAALDPTPQQSSGKLSCATVLIPQSVSSSVIVPLNILRNERLVFVDDAFAVCSWHIRRQDGVQRHFFLPRDWLSEQALSMLHLTTDGTLLCPKQGTIAVISSKIGSMW